MTELDRAILTEFQELNEEDKKAILNFALSLSGSEQAVTPCEMETECQFLP